MSFDTTRIGVSIGSGIGGLGSIEDNAIILKERGSKENFSFFCSWSNY